ncbi:MAG: lactonase, partial [Cytophagaceae bacterium SCN 52-12]
MKAKLIGIICILAGVCVSREVAAQEKVNPEGLTYDRHTQGTVPVPPSERMLQSVVATRYHKVTDNGHSLEGAVFDREGNLLFCDVTGRRVLRLTPDKELSTIVTFDKLHPGGLAFHKDGRLFVAAIDLADHSGTIVAVNPDGSGMQNIIAPEAGYLPNDLVFDRQGGFYFTDFKGTATEPRGGVYYVSPDFATVTPVLPNLALANGVALSPDGKDLWVTEFGRNLLHRVRLADAT